MIDKLSVIKHNVEVSRIIDKKWFESAFHVKKYLRSIAFMEITKRKISLCLAVVKSAAINITVRIFALSKTVHIEQPN